MTEEQIRQIKLRLETAKMAKDVATQTLERIESSTEYKQAADAKKQAAADIKATEDELRTAILALGEDVEGVGRIVNTTELDYEEQDVLHWLAHLLHYDLLGVEGLLTIRKRDFESFARALGDKCPVVEIAKGKSVRLT